jgi:FkbH-like protein
LQFKEPIRLVIWDLDETFWRGTLEEGEVSIPPEHAAIVRALARRGIVSSVCSKNDHTTAKARLEQEDLWDWFVFSRIEYTFKSNLVADIVEQIGLRPETILFIDDNPFNRAEVAERIPAINIADETNIPQLLDHPQLKGRPDDELTRLKRYRVLDSRQSSFSAAADPTEFLRNCKIAVSFHFDVEAQFERIHELVNRTNQLNFTKLRWQEDVETARSEYVSRCARAYGTHAAYIKVRDRYGYYGICGFFETEMNGSKFMHFLFSCRVLNMGVEQFAYQYLKFPNLKIADKVVVSLTKSAVVDWIEIVADAEDEVTTAKPRSDLTVCLHGPCELVQSAHYLRPYFTTIEEFQYPRAGWGIIRPLLRYLILQEELKERGISNLADLGLPARFPAFDFAALGSAFFNGEADVCVWSFSLETQIAMYRHIASGLVMPISLGGFDDRDITKLTHHFIAPNSKATVDDFRTVKRRFEYVGRVSSGVLAADLKRLRAQLKEIGKPFVVIDLFDDLAKIDRPKYRKNCSLNSLVRESLKGLRNVHYIRFAECVSDRSEEIVVNHFARGPYIRLATRIREVVGLLRTPMDRRKEVMAGATA